MFGLFSHKPKESITVDELHQKLGVPDGSLFVDVRERDEWDAGHINGFRHIPLSELELHAKEIEAEPQIYLLCHSGGRSGRACALLSKSGHEKVFNVSGGISEWIARGYPVVQ